MQEACLKPALTELDKMRNKVNFSLLPIMYHQCCSRGLKIKQKEVGFLNVFISLINSGSKH